ncbi:hypothetical protein [Dokdonia sp. LLG6352-1]|uniref:hypothetical protein n=1 Tax=Dokdonia sp. LLG6352-1 TaxID=3160831 RepID=UPI003863631D
MKNLAILRKLISLYYYLMVILFAIGLITIPFLLYLGKKTEVSFFGDQININSLSSTKTAIVLFLIGSLYLLYFLSIRLIKNTVDILATGVYFTQKVICNFKKAGNYFIAIGIGATIVKIIVDLLVLSELKINIDGGMLVFILFGLFFMFLSEAFAKAQTINEENNLTI